MKIVSAAEMRDIDRATAERFGVSSITLMENAGSAVAGFVLYDYPQAERIGLLCGKGNNGGDGFVENEAYDPKTDTWEALAPMAIPRHGLHGATCAVIGNMVHVPGGGPVPGGQVQGAYHDAFTFD